MRGITIKVDVDTLAGTREGVPRLQALFRRLDIPATFLFSLGPDHTGRAIRRVFRRGFLSKVRRTSVATHYGFPTLLYGTLLPGPDIGARCRSIMLSVANDGFEVGVHAFDHVKWQDGVANASFDWTREQLGLAVERFEQVFGFSPTVHGAAGWQMNEHVPVLERLFGFDVASDTRGREPFMPAGGGVMQIPTTLPTLDELVGVNGATASDAVSRLIELTGAPTPQHHVFTAHAELEGRAYLNEFEELLQAWRHAGFEFRELSDAARFTSTGKLPICKIADGELEGRSGRLALQAGG